MDFEAWIWDFCNAVDLYSWHLDEDFALFEIWVQVSDSDVSIL